MVSLFLCLFVCAFFVTPAVDSYGWRPQRLKFHLQREWCSSLQRTVCGCSFKTVYFSINFHKFCDQGCGARIGLYTTVLPFANAKNAYTLISGIYTVDLLLVTGLLGFGGSLYMGSSTAAKRYHCHFVFRFTIALLLLFTRRPLILLLPLLSCLPLYVLLALLLVQQLHSINVYLLHQS